MILPERQGSLRRKSADETSSADVQRQILIQYKLQMFLRPAPGTFLKTPKVLLQRLQWTLKLQKTKLPSLRAISHLAKMSHTNSVVARAEMTENANGKVRESCSMAVAVEIRKRIWGVGITCNEPIALLKRKSN